MKKANKNTSLDVLNLDEGSILFTRSTLFLSVSAVFHTAAPVALFSGFSTPESNPRIRGLSPPVAWHG